jgi:uncharacterized repeat protein (TIGR04076 family)
MNQKIIGVKVTVLEVKDECSLGYKAGDSALITEHGVEGRLCIHALYSLLPAAFAMLYDAEFPWLADKDVKTHACPDAAKPVIFELRKIRKDE